jgi:hypothetical protein
MYRIRAFRAIDDPASCKKFADGHLNVLLEYGVTKVTTANLSWFHNPGVYVILIESEDGNETYGGERIHIANNHAKLPIEEAVSLVDDNIYNVTAQYKAVGVTGELCGLWNSKAIAGRGFSSLLTKLGVAMAKRLEMNSLFVLCAPYTVAMCQAAGFEIEESVGSRGTFNYPKIDLIATALLIKDLEHLPFAQDDFRSKIDEFASKPFQENFEVGPKDTFHFSLNLNIEKPTL